MERSKKYSRREFLKIGQAGALGASIASGSAALRAQSPAAPRNVRIVGPEEISRRILGPDDFTFLGAFRIPRAVAGKDAAWGRGLALRYVNGQPHLISLTVDSFTYEVNVPAVAPGTNYPSATVVRTWGDIASGRRVGDGFGLYWDEADQRLYWTSGIAYNATYPDTTPLGYSLLDDAASTIKTVEGPWRFTGRGCKATQGGVLPIPRWFADAYCQGKRLGVGFGGYFSVCITGPAHMGPALCAIAPPNPAEIPAKGSLPFVNLLGYPFNPKPYTNPDRCHRDTDYTNEFDSWNPKDGVGYWSWTDWLWQGAVWIDRPDKHGVVYFPTLGRGRTWYADATLHAERAAHAWFVYDPADLAAVAQKKKEQWQVQPAAAWDVKYANLTYPLRGWRDYPWNMVTGATYDPQSQRLYVAVRFCFGTGPESQHLVNVYQVA